MGHLAEIKESRGHHEEVCLYPIFRIKDLKPVFNPTEKAEEKSRVLGTGCAFGTKELKDKVNQQYQDSLL